MPSLNLSVSIFAPHLRQLLSLSSDVPHLHPHHIEFLAFIAQRLITECGAGFGDAFVERVVEPEAVVSVPITRVSKP